jgi:retron-type reverse transcriptase
MNMTKPKQKPFAIPKLLVWEAWRQVKANKGAPGVDEQDLEDFEADLKNNLYRVWNRMSSGSYLPPPVLAVEIPKSHGSGVRVLGVPTVADMVAQMVVAKFLEPLVEPRYTRTPMATGRGGGPGRGRDVPGAVLEVRLGDRS